MTVDKKIKGKNVPKLRFSGFSGEWEEKRLGEVCEIKTGNKDTQDKDDNGKYPFFVRSNTVEKINSYSYDGEAILTSGDGVGVGKNFHYINGRFDFHQRVYSLRLFKAGYSGKFIYNIFSEKFHRRVKNLSAKNSVDSVRMEMISDMKAFFPSLLEQQKIADFLGLVDEWVGNLRAQKECLERYKKGVMRKIFAREIRFKDDQGRDFVDWEEKRLGEVLNFLPTNSFSRDKLNYIVGDVKNIHYGDIHTKFRIGFNVKNENVPYIDKDLDLSKISQEFYCKEGDLVMVDASEDYKDIGKVIELIDLNNEKFLAGLHTFLLRKKHEKLFFKGFLSYLLKTNFSRKQIMKIATGISVLGISKKNLSTIILNCPCFEEQQKLAKFLTSIDLLIDLNVAQITQANVWKKGLMQQLFI